MSKRIEKQNPEYALNVQPGQTVIFNNNQLPDSHYDTIKYLGMHLYWRVTWKP